jgi:hypothetical protein
MRNLIAVLLISGCPDGGASVLLRIESAATMPPSSLRLRLFGNGELIPPTLFTLANKSLPATVLIAHLSASTPNFRVLVDGLDTAGKISSQGAVEIPLQSGQQTSATVRLTDGLLADSDGDGIPDSIDDCALVPDPDQTCHARTDMATPDLAGVDLAGLDLSGIDLSGIDLAQPHDLAGDFAGVDLRGVNACPAGALFCDTFESGNTSMWSGVHSDATITLGVDINKPFNGTHSLHVQTSGGSNVAWLIHSMPVPVTSGTVSLRLYVYAESSFNFPLYFMFLHRDSGDDDYVAGIDYFGGAAGQWTIYDKNGGSYTNNSAYSFAGATWHCVELEIDLTPIDMGAATNVAKLYIDQNAPILWTRDNTASAPSIAEMDVGVTYQNASAANDFFIDDVALSTQHIGCE